MAALIDPVYSKTLLVISVVSIYIYTPVSGAPIVRRKIHSTRQDNDHGYHSSAANVLYVCFGL